MTSSYNHTDRDLCRLVGDRVGDAIRSVLQIAEGPEQAFLIATTAQAEAAAMMAGAFAALHDLPLDETDPTELAIAILERTKEVAAEERALASEPKP